MLDKLVVRDEQALSGSLVLDLDVIMEINRLCQEEQYTSIVLKGLVIEIAHRDNKVVIDGKTFSNKDILLAYYLLKRGLNSYDCELVHTDKYNMKYYIVLDYLYIVQDEFSSKCAEFHIPTLLATGIPKSDSTIKFLSNDILGVSLGKDALDNETAVTPTLHQDNLRLVRLFGAYLTLSFTKSTYKSLLETLAYKYKLKVDARHKCTDTYREELLRDIALFQNNALEVSKELFIDMLKFCNLKVPKAVSRYLVQINRDGGVSTLTGSKSINLTIIYAMDKLKRFDIKTVQ